MSQHENFIADTLLSFHDISWKTEDGKSILHGVSGVVQAGKVMAIMGASGSGKTTLLQILAGQRQQSEGAVRINGEDMNRAMKRYLGMVPQEDVLLPTVTVEEAISFSAAIRMPSNVSEEERKQLVEQQVADLGLQSIRSSRIGDPRRRKGISGGEKKRVSIAMEMVHRPRVLLLDEPTSGSSNVAVAFTIHQPSSRDFHLFDKLLLLSEGRTAYYGSARGALAHFEAVGHACPEFTNPAEFFLDLLSGFDVGLEGKEKIISSFEKSDAHRVLEEELEQAEEQRSRALQRASSSADKRKFLANEENFATTFTEQFVLLFRRAWINSTRNPVSARAAFGRSVTMGLLVGFLYRGVQFTQASVQDRTGALYFVITTQIFSAQASMRIFLEERDLFFRERLAGAYRTSSYYWSKSLADTPLQLVCALVFSLLGYFLVGLQASLAHVLTYCLSVIITTLAAESYVVMIGALVPDDKLGVILGPLGFALMSLLGGFFLNIESLPVWISWLQFSSLFRYSFAAIMQNEFKGLSFTCSPEDLANWVEKLDEGTKAHVMEFLHLIPCPTPDGETHLKRLKVDGMSITWNILILTLLFLLFRVVGFIALYHRSNRMLPKLSSTLSPDKKTQ
uniref:ABC transporter domain-containing protein n=1 Tax=Guillardia theta TaxID=55529 RepID=A0A7S4UJF0_GUITH|mmetsp:Transcript_43379/g.137123  ORF Transcript_43379/g.137123 Transcript_43379/m.137123 type:complete len:622 (+) Transcript_43379:47-1912(+)